MSSPRQGAGAQAAALVVGVLAVSSSAVLVRVADAPALALSFWRCALGALALAPFALRARRRAAPLERAQWRQLAGAGVALAVHFALFISSLSFTSVASSTLLVTMSPLFVGAGAALLLAEPPPRRTWAGMGLAMGGAVVVALADVAGTRLDGRALLGDALAFAGAIAVAGYLLVGRVARRRLPVSVYAGAVYGIAAAVLAVASLASGAALSGFDRMTWLAIAGLVVGPQLLGHTVFNTLLSSVSATVVAVVVIAEPLGATLLAWWLLDEGPTAAFWLGAPLLLAGVYLAATSRRAIDPEAAVVAEA
jgi:drug/metabolite transporter (DMT)-like permease